MPFKLYQTMGEVLREFNITYLEDNFVQPYPINISDYIRAELDFNLKEVVIENSEYAVCETLIYPILREVWKNYINDFMLWSHQSLKYDDNLSGVPDYIIAQRSPLGKVVFEKPYFIVVEAKKDNFSQGWGQCLAELIAVQKLNNNPEQTIFGIVSNGERWEFGKLYNSQFTKNLKGYNIEGLDDIFAAIAYIFEQCKLQLK